jgi:hypothetical protein
VYRSGLPAATRRKSDDAYQRRAEKQHAAACALEENYAEPGQAGKRLNLSCSFQSVRPGHAFSSARIRRGTGLVGLPLRLGSRGGRIEAADGGTT